MDIASTIIKPITLNKKWFKILLLAGMIIVAVFLHYLFLSDTAFDFTKVYRPAANALLSGKSPYNDLGYGAGFYNPPWALIPFIPLAFLPEKLGSTIMFIISIISYTLILRHSKAKIIPAYLFFISVPILVDLKFGNITWLSMLGFIMPPQIGLFFVLIKPQIGGAVAIYWLYEAWKNGGIKQVVKTFLPVTIAFLLSFVIYGLWITHISTVIQVDANVSLFPYSIPIGIGLIIASLKLRKINFVYMASPFLSPYICLNGYAPVMLGMIGQSWTMVIAFFLPWVISLIHINR